MGLALAALYYFVFVVYAPQRQQVSAPSSRQASSTPTVLLLSAARNFELAPDETVSCGHGKVRQSAVEDIRAQIRKVADKTFGASAR